MTNHEVWVVFSWALYGGTILRGAFRASGINHTLMLNVTSGSHILLLFLIGSVLMDSTGQLPGFWSAFLTGAFAFVVIAGGLFVVRRKFEWNETMAVLRARARLSASMEAQPNRPSQHRAIAEGEQADPARANLPATTSVSN
jgi:hypothetical protein